MRRPLIILTVLIALVAGLAPGASAAQRVRFDHRGEYSGGGMTEAGTKAIDAEVFAGSD